MPDAIDVARTLLDELQSLWPPDTSEPARALDAGMQRILTDLGTLTADLRRGPDPVAPEADGATTEADVPRTEAPQAERVDDSDGTATRDPAHDTAGIATPPVDDARESTQGTPETPPLEDPGVPVQPTEPDAEHIHPDPPPARDPARIAVIHSARFQGSVPFVRLDSAPSNRTPMRTNVPQANATKPPPVPSPVPPGDPHEGTTPVPTPRLAAFPPPAPEPHTGPRHTGASPPGAHASGGPRHAYRLPNANAGRPYMAPLRPAFTAAGVSKITIARELPDGLRLQDTDLCGTPTTAGEYRISWDADGIEHAGALLLTVNPDPRSLWRDEPSDRTDPYWKPDTDRRTEESAVARVVAASVRGRSHAHVGSFRDDDFALRVPAPEEGPHGWHVLVVADGAGGAKHSRKGSAIACQVVTEQLVRTLVTDPPPDLADFEARTLHATEADKSDASFWSPRLYTALVPAINAAQGAIRDEAEARGASRRDYHTTLLVAILRRTTGGAWFVGTYWIGDGAIGMWDGDWSAPKVFGEADTGEFSGETTFLTHEDFGKSEQVNRRLRYSIVPSFSCFALMTDGISDPWFDGETKLHSGDAWRALVTDLTPARDDGSLSALEDTRLLAWMSFWSPGNHDDRTLLLVLPKAQGTA